MTNFLNGLFLHGIIILASLTNCFGQPAPKKIKTYKAIVATSTQKQKMKGILQEVRDSSILILSKNTSVNILASTIINVRIKRKGAAGKGALVGGIIGLGVGVIGGFASGDDVCDAGSLFCFSYTAEEKALVAGLTLGMGGALVGTIIGSIVDLEKITVNGDLNKYQNNVDKLKKYAPITRNTP